MKLMKAIVGDICGSFYEFARKKADEKPKELMLEDCHFTDDTVCTVAIADAILHNPENPNFNAFLRRWFLRYPKAGYGKKYSEWVLDEKGGDSFGNGCCMRLYPISIYYKDPLMRMAMIAKSCSGSHNHIMSYYYALLVDSFASGCPQYDLNFTPKKNEFLTNFNIDEYRKTYKFDCTCQGSVPEAISIVFHSKDYEDCIKNAIYLGGDTDTIACMAGMMCKYELPSELEEWAWNKLPKDMQNVITKFEDEITKFNQQG